MEILRREKLKVSGGEIPIRLCRDKDELVIDIDGAEWLRTKSDMHAIVLFNMMQEHITDYMHYAVR